MNKVYEKNRKALQKKYTDIYNKIDMEDNDSLEFEVKTQCMDGRSIIYLEYNDKIMQLESLYNNDEINEIWTNNVLTEEKLNTKLLLFGMGNISFVYSLISKMREDSKLYIYEPNLTIFKVLIHTYDITDIINNKKCIITIGTCMKESLRNTYEAYFEYTDVYNYIDITSLNYNNIFEKEYKEYRRGLEMTLSTVASNFGYYSNSGKFVNSNIFLNIPSLLDSKSLYDFGKHIDDDIPAIIVAAGPSLAKNIKYLKEAKGKAIIIAIDAAMRALVRNGIMPDVCVTVDFNKELGHFDEGDANKIPMICSLVSTASFVKNSQGIKLFYCENTPYFNKFIFDKDIKFDTLPTGGTVANNALSVAIQMGCKTIIIIGQDLAYTDNMTHAPGTVKGDLKTDPESIKNKCYVEDLEGNMLLTCGEFVLYKQWIEETVKTRDDIHFINATEGGAGIKGCEHITLKEAIERECKSNIDINKSLRQTEDFFTGEQKTEFIEYISNIPKEFKKLIKYASEGANCYSEMISLINSDNYNSLGFVKLYKKSKRLFNRINQNLLIVMVYNEIQHHMNENMKTIYNLETDEKEELLITCQKGKESFDRICNTAKMLEEKVKIQLEECIAEARK